MFEWLFNHPESDFTTGALSFAAGYPVWLLYTAVAVVAIVLAASLWWRRKHLSVAKLSVLWILQTAVAALLLLLIWQPSLDVKSLRAGENSVAIVLDNSASMYQEEANRTRIDAALQRINDDIAPALSDSFNIDFATVGNQLTLTENLQQRAPPANRSNISGSLIDVLDQARAEPLAAVVIATDGSDNVRQADSNFWDKLSAFNVPVHTVGVGRTEIPEDMEITAVEIASTTLPGSLERALVTIRHGGSLQSETARLKVYAGDNIIALQEQKLPQAAGEISITIDIDASEVGLKDLRFEVEAAARDTNIQNNSRRRLLQVEEKQRRILYFEGEPRWEYKFIRRAVTNSKAVALVTILRTTPNKFYRQGIESPEQHASGFPETRAELYAYDAVIIGNVDAISLNATQHQLLHDFVSERGGAVMMLGGSNALSDGGWHISPLAKALPVVIDQPAQPTFARVRAKVQLTPNGAHSAITRFDPDTETNRLLWSELPELADFQRIEKLKPAASTLLEAVLPEGRFPLLSFQPYGKGNSYLMATSGTWRWQMQMPYKDQRHEIFWQQLLQTIAATAPERLTVATDKPIYLDDTSLRLHAKLLNSEFQPVAGDEIRARVTAPDGSVQTLDLEPDSEKAGEYRAAIEAVATGSWQIDVTAKEGEQEIASVTRWIHREDGTAESYALAQNATFLERISQLTGGQYWPLDDAAQLPDAIKAARNGLVRQQTLPLWNMPFFFLLILGLKLVEWMLRMIWGRL